MANLETSHSCAVGAIGNGLDGRELMIWYSHVALKELQRVPEAANSSGKGVAGDAKPRGGESGPKKFVPA